MPRISKLTIITVIAVFLMLLAAGCGSSDTSETPAASTTTTSTTTTSTTAATTSSISGDLEQIVEDAVVAIADVDSYQCDLDYSISIPQESGSEPLSTVIDATMTVDQINENMSMSMITTIDMEDMGVQEATIEIYVVDDYGYVMMDLPIIGSQWIKFAANDNDALESFNAGMLDEELAIIASPAEMEYNGTATVDGTECHVIRIVPNAEAMLQYAQSQNSTDADFDAADVEDITSLVRQMDFTVYIAKDTGYLMKIDNNTYIDYSAVDDPAAEGMELSVSGSILFYNYDAAPAVIVPDEAANAIEMSPDDL